MQWRRPSYGVDSEAGGRFVGKILGVVATCRQQGRDVLEFLTGCCQAALHRSAPPSAPPGRKPLVGSSFAERTDTVDLWWCDMTHEASRSQGKGSRRSPGRRGGARRPKHQDWEKRATHRTESPDALPQPTAKLSFSTIYGKTPSEAIYQFDQQMARVNVPYFAEFEGGRGRYVFTITVAESGANDVRRVIGILRPPGSRVRSRRFAGWWSDIEPTRLSKAYSDHRWLFAAYRESASERADGMEYVAFLFRDKERTVFGIREWLGEHLLVKHDVLEGMAHRIVTDAKYRRRFVSDDPDLADMWKRH